MAAVLIVALSQLFAQPAFARGGSCGRGCDTAFAVLLLGSILLACVLSSAYFGYLAIRFNSIRDRYKDGRTFSRFRLSFYSIASGVIAIVITVAAPHAAAYGTLAAALVAPVIIWSLAR